MSLPWRKISKGEMKGRIREEVVDLLPSSFFEDPVALAREPGGLVIKDTKLRWASILSLPGGGSIFLKRDRTKSWAESLKFLLLPSKARREWSIACQARRRNLNVPNPLGWMERRHRGFVEASYYLSDALGAGISLMDHPETLREEGNFQGFVRSVRRLHDAGVLHQDFHAGNFLFERGTFFLVDLHSARIIRSLNLNQRLWGLSQIFHSLRSIWEEGDRGRFLQTYFEKEPHLLQREKELLRRVHEGMDRLQRRQWKSRAKRCIKESTEFSITNADGIRYFHRKRFPLREVKGAVEGHHRCLREKTSGPSSRRGASGSERLVKDSPRVAVSRFDWGEGRICVKQFRYLGFWEKIKNSLRGSKGRRAWMGGNGLRARGIPCVALYGLVEKKAWFCLTESYVVMEALRDAGELDRYLAKGFRDFNEKRRFIRRFAEWLSSLHEQGVYHRDMKTCNILVSGGGEWEFCLLDLEDVILDRKVRQGEIVRNLVQLNGSIPISVTRTDRLRFLRRYLEGHPIGIDKKRVLKKISDETRKRGVVYMAPWGLVEEGRNPPGGN